MRTKDTRVLQIILDGIYYEFLTRYAESKRLTVSGVARYIIGNFEDMQCSIDVDSVEGDWSKFPTPEEFASDPWHHDKKPIDKFVRAIPIKLDIQYCKFLTAYGNFKDCDYISAQLAATHIIKNFADMHCDIKIELPVGNITRYRYEIPDRFN